MPRFRHQVLRCTAFGTAYGGVEEWSTGCYFGVADADVGDPTQVSADAYEAAWNTFFTTITTGVSSQWSTVGVRVSKLDAETGHVMPDKNFYSYPTVPYAGTGGAQNFAAQLTLVASLQARPDAGLASKGRMFLPGIAHSLGPNGKLTATDTAKVVTSLTTMFNALNDNLDLPGRLINASAGRLDQLFDNQPKNRYVQDVLVGDVYDTQRRRRNQLQETYSTGEIFLD